MSSSVRSLRSNTSSPYKTRSQTVIVDEEEVESGGEEIVVESLSDSVISLESTTTKDIHYPPSLSTHSFQSNNSTNVQTLPPADGGRRAVQFLISAFIVELVVWGTPSAYGVFLQYYTENGIGKNSNMSDSSLLPLVGSFASGLMYLLGPPVAWLINPRPKWRVPAIRIGCLICCLALLISSFATTAWHLLLTQGLLYSVGGSLAYYPTFSFLSEWFEKKRGLALGVVFAGTALGGLILPFLLDYLLSHYDSAITLQALAVGSFILLAIAIPFLHPRIPVGSTTITPRDHPSSKSKVWKDKRFIIFLIANTAQAIGYFLPMLYLPTFAASLGISGAAGSGLLAAVNLTSVLSRVLVGILSDRFSPHRIAALTMGLSSLSVLLIWGFSTSFYPLLIFSLILGVFSGGFTSLYSRVVQDASKDDPALNSNLFGWVSFTRGIGSILTAPMSSFLILHGNIGAASSTGYGISNGTYGSLVLVSGLALGFAAVVEGIIAF